MDGGIEKLAFELALKALGQQEAAVNELRARTGTLLAASSVATSFLGARVLDATSFGMLAAVALAAFMVSLLASAYVLFPRRRLVFALDSDALFQREGGGTGDLTEQYRWLAHWLEEARRSNQPVFDRLAAGVGVATVSLVAEAMLLTIELGVP